MYFFTPKANIEIERSNPGSTEKLPSAIGTTDGVFIMGQAVYFISQLLGEW